MKGFNIFLYEWKHFIRSPFKVVALLLFVLAGVYGLHNGASLYNEQMANLEKIKERSEQDRQQYISYYEEGKKGPDNRPWIDMTTPFWSIWYSNTYHFKTPSPAMVYSIGQAEQYGFYKRVTFRASPYDPDMTNEIANPERLQTGTLDFAFALVFLLPLLLLILLYNIKGMETEQGFMPLIEVQTASKSNWLLSRVTFYGALVFGVIMLLLAYGAMLTGVFALASQAFGQMVLLALFYLLFWLVIYSVILVKGKSILGNTLTMVGVWLLFAFIIPATVHQWVSIEKPTNLMTDFIDATRDERIELYEQSDSVIMAQLKAMFPEIKNSPVAQDSIKKKVAMSESTTALFNELMKKSIAKVEEEHQERNALVASTFWFNPVSFFQNRFNYVAQTHFANYQEYRAQIQQLIDQQIKVLVQDVWNGVEVDKDRYLEYGDKIANID